MLKFTAINRLHCFIMMGFIIISVYLKKRWGPFENRSLFCHVIGMNLGRRFNGLITSVWEERVYFYATDYSLLCSFCSEMFPLPLGT